MTSSPFSLTDSAFLQQADVLLRRVSLGADEAQADIEATRSGNVLELEFVGKRKIIINLQQPLHEVWMAAKEGGYHFRFDGQNWCDTRDQVDFYQRLNELASICAGEPVSF